MCFRGVPSISTALDTRESWHYELNSRLSDPAALEGVHVDSHGQLFLQPTAAVPTIACGGDAVGNGLGIYVNAWSLETDCNGLVFLSQPLTIANSSCQGDNGESLKNAGGDYYGLACVRNRTEWCQRGYKEDVYWPAAIGHTCEIRRTGVDKSSCYNSGQLHQLVTYKHDFVLNWQQWCVCRLPARFFGLVNSKLLTAQFSSL